VAAEGERVKRAGAVATAGHRIDELSAGVEARIKTDPAWIAQGTRIAQAEAIAKAGSDKAAQAEADRDSKRQPYENDPLFMYLWRSKYATSAYRAGPIVRFFDSKVAKFVGYDTARANFFMLTEIPVRLRAHANRLAEEVNAERARRSALERQALEAEGVVPLEKELEAAEASLAKAEARLTQAKAALDADRASAADPEHDADYKRAVEVLTSRLGREDLLTLYERARQTPTPADDRIVLAMRDNEQAVVTAEAQAQDIRKAVIQVTNKRAELERSHSQFRQAGYDDPMCGFINGDLIGSIIGGILGGAMSSRALQDAFDAGFRRHAPRADSNFGGGVRLPRGPWGGGSMGGGGGFRTGGGF
jgi:hypothetical protein